MTSRGFAGLKRLRDEKIMPTSKIWKNKIKSEKKTYFGFFGWMNSNLKASMKSQFCCRGSFLFFLPWEGYTLVGTTDVKTKPDLHHQVPEDLEIFQKHRDL